jgi:DNA end-binding protein Ku
MHATASAPNRSTTSLTISFGLINIPVSVYTATVDTKTVRHEFTKDGHPVGRKLVDKVTGDEVAYGDIIKAVEHGSVLVPLDDDEIAEATGHESGVAPIVGRIPLASLATDFITEKVYQLRPKSDKKVKTANDKAFALLVETLAASDEAALVKVSIRGAVARWGAVTPDGYLRILHSADQVREALPLPDADLSDAELALAKQLLAAIPSVDVTALRDESSELVEEFVATKAEALAAGGEVVAPVKVEAPSPYDLLSQIQASMASVTAA